MPRILVADDNTNIQKMVALAFQGRGIDVISVGNGEAAVRRLPELTPDLILADIFMPVRNGYELCEWVKKDLKFSHIPVILLVGAFDPFDEKEARRVGADGVLKKPFIPPDPLIAMVTSTLAKNSKIPLETTPKRETVAQPPVQPVARHAAPAIINAEPVTDFPESGTDDASLAYGFGVGRRTLGDHDAGESTDAPTPRSESDSRNEEEFQDASTTKDWRRSAMEFEIPEETSRKAAFSSEEHLDHAFPSEKDVPPRHIAALDPLKGLLSPETLEAERNEETPAAAIDIPQISASEPIALVDPEIPSSTETEPSTIAETKAAAIEAPHALEAEPMAILAPDSSSTQAYAAEIQEASAAEIQSIPETGIPSKPAHWMDSMASPSEQPRGNWFTSIFGSRKRTEKQETPAEAASAARSVVEETPLAEASSAPETAFAQESVEPAHTEEDPFFADEPETTEIAVTAESSITEGTPVSTDPLVQAQTLAEIESEDQAEVLLEARKAEEPAAKIEGEASEAVSSTPLEVSSELIPEASDEVSLAKDPELIEPTAVRVTSDPLLIDESPRESLTGGTRQQEVPPLYSFLSAKPQEGAHEDAGGEPIDDQPPIEDFPVEEDHMSSAEFSSEIDESKSASSLPDRAALSEIPFLNPPLAFLQRGFNSDAEGYSPDMVDVVVQRLLDRIEPQLRELLSQNVLKPLVENLLQGELENKHR